MPLKAAIIGYGYMGKIREQTLRNDPKWQIEGIYHTQIEKTMDGDTVDSWQELVDDEKIDAIFVCVPNYLTRDIVIEALSKDKHVFAEKPPGMSSQQVFDMQEAENKSGKVLKFGFNHRMHPAVLKARELVDSHRFGDILWMRGRYGKSVDAGFNSNWRSSRKFAGGGILMDQGIHMVDLFLYFCDHFDQAKAFVSNSYWNGDVEDNAFAILKNSKGQLAQLHSTMTQWRYLFSLEIFLSAGYVTINGLLSKSGRYGPETIDFALNRTPAPMASHSEINSITYNVDNSWAMELKEFTEAILHGVPIRVGNSHDARKLMETIELIYADAADSSGPSLSQAFDSRTSEV